MRQRAKKDAALLGLVAALYCAGHIWRPYAEGWLTYVLNCYYNDILAGVAILAWTNLAAVRWGRREPLSRRQSVLMLLAYNRKMRYPLRWGKLYNKKGTADMGPDVETDMEPDDMEDD